MPAPRPAFRSAMRSCSNLPLRAPSRCRHEGRDLMQSTNGMTRMRRSLIVSVFGGFLVMTAAAGAGAERTREIVRQGDVAIDVIAEGTGPPIVLLPSRGRDSEDYDEVAAG